MQGKYFFLKKCYSFFLITFFPRRSTLLSVAWDHLLRSLLPLTEWLPVYNWRRDLFADVSAGLTVGVMHIPQGMAYAILVTLTAIVHW